MTMMLSVRKGVTLIRFYYIVLSDNRNAIREQVYDEDQVTAQLNMIDEMQSTR